MTAWSGDETAPVERVEMDPTDELGPRSPGDADDDPEPLGREWIEALIQACRERLAAPEPE